MIVRVRLLLPLTRCSVALAGTDGTPHRFAVEFGAGSPTGRKWFVPENQPDGHAQQANSDDHADQNEIWKKMHE